MNVAIFLRQTENAPSTLCGKLERTCLFSSKLLNSYISSQRIVYGGFFSSASFSYTLLPNKSLTWSELLWEQFDIKKKCRSSPHTFWNTCWGYSTIMLKQRVPYACNCLSRTQSGLCTYPRSPPWEHGSEKAFGQNLEPDWTSSHSSGQVRFVAANLVHWQYWL